MKYFNPFEDIRVTRHNLPHWQQAGVTYFITYRLADAIPAHLLRRWDQARKIWLSFHPEPWTHEEEMEYHRRFSSQMDHWLDAGHGSCLLEHPEARQIVEASLRYFEGERYHSFSWVIMPNHLHILATLAVDWKLEKVIATWKRRSCNVLNEWRGGAGKLWQDDYFDRIIRDGRHFDNVVRYIRRNPVKARLRADEFTLFESEVARDVL